MNNKVICNPEFVLVNIYLELIAGNYATAIDIAVEYLDSLSVIYAGDSMVAYSSSRLLKKLVERHSLNCGYLGILKLVHMYLQCPTEYNRISDKEQEFLFRVIALLFFTNAKHDHWKFVLADKLNSLVRSIKGKFFKGRRNKDRINVVLSGYLLWDDAVNRRDLVFGTHTFAGCEFPKLSKSYLRKLAKQVSHETYELSLERHF